MRILWAPWRMKYIEQPAEEGCIFCDKPAEGDDQKNLILYRGEFCFVVMNKYPYNNGHLMVIPFRHVRDISKLTAEEKCELMDLLVKSKEVLAASVNPDGFNIGMNLGRTAGAGVDDHLHFHIVPRWNGDTNFMPVIGKTDVISEGLEQTWIRLKKAFDEIG